MPETVTFDHYEVLTRDDGSLYELGRGAMGITYKAFDTNLRIPVALKVINATFLHSEVARQRFIREARSAAKLRHRNVASVFHLGTDSDAYFYAMEFIDGETVEALIKRQGPLTPLAALQIAAQVARALNAAQPHGLVHRDIKPANLMLVREDDDLAVKVIDFGLAKSSHPGEGEEESTTVSMAGFVGTPHFASPEQLDEKEIDVRSDIYSLGVTLWYMLAGQAPFSGSMAQVMSQHLSKPPPFEKLNNIPAALAKLLGRMLEKDPARRPQTAAELRREIDECIEQLRAGGHPGEATVDSGQEFATIFDATAAGEKAETRFKTGAVIAGRYRIIRDLGETNTGHLFHAQQVSPERGVRLLVLNREIVEDAAGYTKIEKDVQRVAAATHRNLLQTYAIETVDYESFVVSEWTDGFSLLELLRARRELSASEVLLLLPQAADGIDHAARLGLRRVELALHQVFVHFPEPGLAKEDLLRRPVAQWPSFALKLNPLTITRDLSASETWAGRQTIVSGLQAAPPEGDETSRTIQSLAAVVYELLGGTLSPFALKGGGSHRYTPIATLSEAGNDILRRALEPRSGFSTAHDFYSALSGIGGLEVERYETRPPPVPMVRAAPRPRIAPPVASKATPPRRKVPMKFFGGVLTIAAIGAAMYFFAQQASKKREQPNKSATIAPPKTTNTAPIATTPTIPSEPPPVVVPLPEPVPVPPVAPPTPTRQEVLKTAVAEANEFERKKDWPRAIEAWLRIAEEYPEGTGKTRLEMLFDDFFERKGDKKAAAEIKPRDLPTIRELAVRVAQLDVVPAMVFLGKSLRETDLAASIQWYSMAADRGDIESLRALGLILSNRGGAGDDAKAFACFESAANKGDRLAKFLLGECYLFGKGVKLDEKRGTDLLREAADAGEAAAMDRLGICYQRGIGVEKDSAEAFRLFSRASDAQYYPAIGNLGILYMTGDGVPQNKQKAVSLFIEGSQVADNCMLFLARAYESGSGVRPNQSKAAEWYQKAADAGNQAAADWCRSHDVKFTPKKPPTAGRRTEGS